MGIKGNKISLSQNLRDKKLKNNSRLYLYLSFFLPAILLGIGFAVNGVYPFGDKQILVTDLWQQYFPFLNNLQVKLQEGSSLFYSWETGMGTNLLALASYYLASPLNFLSILVPPEFLREAMTVFLLIKIGCAGLFTAMFLKYTFKTYDISIAFFGSLYALCSFTMGYYWNTIWFDTFALMPLVILGVVALVREGKFKVYVIALALAIISNYYIGLFVCIFTAFSFLGLVIITKMSIKQFFVKTGQMIYFTAISLAMTAFITIPAYINLGLTVSSENQFPSTWSLENDFTEVLGNFTAFNAPNVKVGLPNIYAGFICIVLIGIYLLSKKISAREKIFSVGLLSFLIVSCNVNVLDYMWHGFHETNMIPYRFSFLICFVIVVMAYRAYTLIDTINMVDVIGMAFIPVFIIVCAVLGDQGEIAIFGSTIIALFVLAVMFLFVKKKINKTILTTMLCVVILIEVICSVLIGVAEVRVTQHSTYPDKKDIISESVDNIEAQDDDEFYRIEFSNYYTLNDPPLYDFPGVSQFSSTANVNVTDFLEGIGILGWDIGNRYYFAETTPLTHAFLDLKYLIAKNGNFSDTVNWSLYQDVKGTKTYVNEKYVSLGFMTDKEILSFEPDKNDPFKAQQELFEKSTGSSEPLYTDVQVKNVGHVNANVHYKQEGVYGEYNYSPQDKSIATTLSWNYEMPEDGVIFAYADISNTENISISGGGRSVSYNIKRPYIISAGEYKKGEIITFSCTTTTGSSGTADIYVRTLNQDVFDKAYEQFSEEKLEITSFETTNIKGTVNAKEDGILYLSIPYEEGWSVYVDGQEKEMLNIAQAMCAVEITQGEHDIELKYIPAGFMEGLILLIAALALFIGTILVQKFFVKKKVAENTENIEE